MYQPSNCPQCQSEDIYHDGTLWICPACSHEWSPQIAAAVTSTEEVQAFAIRDANGNALANGDSVTVLKELKIKGASSSIKVGTKVKNIRLVDDATDGHNIVCKIDGVGTIHLKSEFVRKA